MPTWEQAPLLQTRASWVWLLLSKRVLCWRKQGSAWVPEALDTSKHSGTCPDLLWSADRMCSYTLTTDTYLPPSDGAGPGPLAEGTADTSGCGNICAGGQLDPTLPGCKSASPRSENL